MTPHCVLRAWIIIRRKKADMEQRFIIVSGIKCRDPALISVADRQLRQGKLQAQNGQNGGHPPCSKAHV